MLSLNQREVSHSKDLTKRLFFFFRKLFVFQRGYKNISLTTRWVSMSRERLLHVPVREWKKSQKTKRKSTRENKEMLKRMMKRWKGLAATGSFFRRKRSQIHARTWITEECLMPALFAWLFIYHLSIPPCDFFNFFHGLNCCLGSRRFSLHRCQTPKAWNIFLPPH